MPDAVTPPASEEEKPENLSPDERSQEEIEAAVDKELGLPSKTEPESQGDETKDEEELEESDEDGDEEEEEPPSGGEKPKESDGDEEAEEPEEPESKDEKPEAAEADTSDLWIEVEDSEGKTRKLTLEDGVPDDFTFKNDKQLFDILQAFDEMRNILKERTDSIEADKDKAQEETQKAERQKEVENNLNSEIDELISAGILDAPKAKPTDKDFLDDPAVKKVAEVIDFMKDNPTLRSFGTALQVMTKQQADAKEKADRKADNDSAKDRGGKVGGSSATAGSQAEAYKSGQFASIYDIPVEV